MRNFPRFALWIELERERERVGMGMGMGGVCVRLIIKFGDVCFWFLVWVWVWVLGFCWVNSLYNKCYFYNNFIISLVVKILEIFLGPKTKLYTCVYIYIYNLGLKKLLLH